MTLSERSVMQANSLTKKKSPEQGGVIFEASIFVGVLLLLLIPTIQYVTAIREYRMMKDALRHHLSLQGVVHCPLWIADVVSLDGSLQTLTHDPNLLQHCFSAHQMLWTFVATVVVIMDGHLAQSNRHRLA